MTAREVVVRFESRRAAKSAFHVGFAVQAAPHPTMLFKHLAAQMVFHR